MKIELISFKTCPFVQRAVIALLEKKVKFDITYIDLKNPPAWFLEISPFGKVPLLRVDGKVLFESAVILEYLDEIFPPSLHPADPFQKAQNRAWMEFGSNLNMQQFTMLTTKDQAGFDEKYQALRKDLQRLEQQIVADPYFNGTQFTLVDAVYGPTLMRFDLMEKFHDFGLEKDCPKMQAWQKTLLSRESVQNSVVPEFADLFAKSIVNADGYAAKWFTNH
jgi:glutathione S-transferase